MKHKLKRISKGYYQVVGTEIYISKDYAMPQYDWVVTHNGTVVGTCLTLREFKDEIQKWVVSP